MSDLHLRRVRLVQESLAEHNLDYLFLSLSPDLYYLTGYSSAPSERLHLLVIAPEGRPTLLFPSFELGLVAHLSSWIDVVGWSETEDPVRLVRRALAPWQRDFRMRIAIGDQTRAIFLLRLQQVLPGTAFVPASLALAPMRRVKDEVELHRLRAAQSMAGTALTNLCEEPLSGRSEKEIASALQRICEDLGYEGEFGAQVGAGPNAACSHQEPTERVVQVGEPLLIDFWAKHAGYYSDCTRTLHVGPPTPEFEAVYDAVRAANAAARSVVRPGVECQSVDRAARAVINEAGFGEYFTHRVGHGVGIDIHEEPYMVEGNRLVLEEGMVFTIEPGIYLPDRFGCRIEDVVAVTTEGAETLTDHTHDPIIVE